VAVNRIILALLPLLCLSCTYAPQRPNVVLIISDDQAFSDFGFMGHETIKTPHLDQLASEGVLFTRGSVPSSLCRPSLASLATGLMPHRHGVTGNDPPRGVNRRKVVDRFKRNTTLPTMLGKAGYRSHQSGKWWEGHYREGGFTHGMTHGDPKRRGRHGDVGLTIGRKGMQPIYDFIESGDDPFFLWYAPFLPHTPHTPPDRILKKYSGKGLNKFVARYYAMCEWFDETCGELLGYLKQKGLEDNTIVVFVTDNGWIQRTDNGRFAPRSKRSPYEGGVRTPIIVKWPGKLTPRTIETPISSLDLCPTILSACGLAVPNGLDGRNLLPLCHDAKILWPPVFGEVFAHDIVDIEKPVKGLRARWVVDGRYKLIWPHDAGSSAQLFDVASDPFEKRDLSGTDPKRVRELKARIEGWWSVDPPAGK
jgi:arylsulfatase A-like enzyme